MHSKKHRQVRKLRSRPKSRRGRSLKGGEPTPYVCEGVRLVEGNNLIQIAVTQIDHETYTFNPVGKTFANYLDLKKYYCDNKSLACVRPTVLKNDGNPSPKPSPSLVELLGISLIIAKQSKKPNGIYESGMFGSLFQTVMNNFYSANGLPTDSIFYQIVQLTLNDVSVILGYVKHAMFFCKYAELPLLASHLTFAKMVLEDGKGGKENMENSSVYDKIFSESRKKMYTLEGLTADYKAAPVPVPAPVPAPVQASSSLEERVARLETAVAALQKK